MFRPRGNAGQANHPAASTSRDTHQTMFQPARDEEANFTVAPTSRVTQQTMFRPVRKIGQANTPTASASRAAHQPMPQIMSNTEPNNTPAASTTRRPPQFILPSRRSAGAINTPTASASRATHQPMPQIMSNAEPNNTPAASTTQMPQQPMFQPARNAVPDNTPTASASRTIQPSTFRPVKFTGPANTPFTSTSAPILEFICLFTHDLRRKKKRWQDGKLKFHTFNKKYMVYDDGGRFIGDGYWQGAEDEFQEGLEMNLDRGMAIVQVWERTGSKKQDLTEILGKRAREVEERRINAATRTPAPTAAPSNPAKRSRGIAVVEATPSITVIPLTPPRNGGAWSKHAEDLLGITRPTRR
ncbi:hypothetical protein V8C37DRAFT_389045 [Trichoderma ceciliae]